jgi:hypothetical protein
MSEIARQTKYNPVPSETKAEIIQDALGRVGSETLEQIAASHSITEPTLWRWLDGSPEYRPALDAHYVDKLRAAVAGYDISERELREAQDPFSLARAREIGTIKERRVKAAQWELERRNALYSNKGGVTVQVGVAVGLTGSAGDLLKEYLPDV